MSQHYRCCCCCPGGLHTPGFENKTLVDIGRGPETPVDKPEVSGGIPSCAVVECATGGDTRHCGPYTPPTEVQPCSAGPGETILEALNNCYKTAPDVDRSQCERSGFKRVMAYKFWHGRLPWTYCATACAAQTVHYRTIEYSIVGMIRDNDDPSSSVTVYNEKRTYTVDRYTGLISESSCTAASTYRVRDPGADTWFDNPGYVFPGPTFYYDVGDCGATKPTVYDFYDGAANNQVATLAVSDTVIEWHIVNATAGLFPGTTQEYVTAGGDIITEKFDVTVTLSDPYTPSDVYDDCVTLQDNWALNDNVKLPFRTDSWLTIGVLCRYHEVQSQVSPETWQNCGYVDPESLSDDPPTGAILGIPFAAGWPDKTFGYYHETWKCCSDMFGTHWYIKSYGAWSLVGDVGDSTDEVMPSTASEWINNYVAGLLPPIMGVLYDVSASPNVYNLPGAMILIKGVENKADIPAHNLFRPCGKDRFMLDTDCASCLEAWDGSSNPVTTDVDLQALGLTTSDYVVFRGGPKAGKVYPVAALSGTSLTLGTETWINPNSMDAYADWVGGTGTNGIVGKVRWRTEAWPICGKARITSAEQDGSKVKVYVDTPYLVIGDVVNFVQGDAADTSLVASITVTDIGAGYFKFTGTYSAINHTQYVKSQGAPLAVWNTTAPRGDYVVQSWEADDATGTFDTTPTNTMGNAFYTRCADQAIVSTPNEDVDAGWDDAGFPSVPTLTACGASTGKVIVQYCADPLWQTPIDCGEGGHTYCAPRVEAMTATKLAAYVTAGAPDLPAGCSFELPGVPGPVGGDCASGNPNGQDVPWVDCVPT